MVNAGVTFENDRVPEKICEKMSRAFATLEARKKIQPAKTKWNVPSARPNRAAGRSESLALPRNTCHQRCTASPQPCQRPQIRKVQLAPCQSPPMAMVITRFKYVKIFHFDRRPGKEKYK